LKRRQFYTNKEQLDRRSQNIVDEMGGVDNLLQYYYANQSFLSLPKVGASTNMQLSLFCEYLESLDPKRVQKDLSYEINLDNVYQYSCIYEIEKAKVSIRVNNVLKKLELDACFGENIESKLLYLQRFFFKNFDFSSTRNLGLKSVNELLALKDRIINGDLNQEFDLIDGSKLEISLSEYNRFTLLFSDNEKDGFLTNGEFDFKKILGVFLITSSIIKEKYHAVMLNRYFKNLYVERKILSTFIHITPERIRQVEFNLKETLLPLAIKLVREELNIELEEPENTSKNNFMTPEDFEHFTFKENTITPNNVFSKFVYQEIHPSYDLIDGIIKPNSRIFELPKVNLLVSKKFIERTDFIKLLEWADEQIYSFEIISFEYNIEILIQRYYYENDKLIEKEDLKDLYLIFKLVKKEVIEVEQKVRLRFENKSERETVINEVYEFLKEKNKGQPTNLIIEYLNSKHFEIKKQDLLKMLHDNSSTFSFLGMGNWNLKEWNKVDGQTRGNFMQLIRNLLLKNNEPLHITDLHTFINKMKKVSIHSLYSNLKLETKGTFKFFNCSFIGLTEKAYDDSWANLPKFKPVYLNKYALSENNDENLNKVKYLYEKFGYPEKHLLFILDSKSGKYK